MGAVQSEIRAFPSSAGKCTAFYTINKLFFVSEKSREQQLARQQVVLQQRYYKHLEEIDLGHRRYAHDLKTAWFPLLRWPQTAETRRF